MDDETDHQAGDENLGFRIGPGHDDLYQRDRQEDGDGIVGAGFDLERRADAFAQIHIAGPEQEEHRRGVGRGDDRPEQKCFEPGKFRQIVGGDAKQQCGHNDAQGRQRQSRRGRLPERVKRRAEARIEENDRQRQRADEIGQFGVVEFDAEPVYAARQTDAEKQEQKRRAEAEGDQARKRRGKHQGCADERQEIDRLFH